MKLPAVRCDCQPPAQCCMERAVHQQAQVPSIVAFRVRCYSLAMHHVSISSQQYSCIIID